MILAWTDQDGDPVAVDADAIVGLSVGDVTRDSRGRWMRGIRVTLIWAKGVGQPFMVAEPFEDVFAAWQKARYSRGPHGESGWKFDPVVERSRG